jgi:peptidoglycan hydrolase-like protein with peptidoglycan-binding domain
VLAAALGQAQLGVTEDPPGSNRTPYGRWYGMDGNPWCGMFAGWAFHEPDGLDLRSLGIYPAYTPAFHDQARAKGWAAVDLGHVQAGDVVFMGFTTGGWIEHVGLATGVLQAGGTVPTVEGNTTAPQDSGRQDNGGGVFQRQRPLVFVRAILRPPYQTTSEHVAVVLDRMLALPPQDERGRYEAPFLRGDDVRAVQHLVGVAIDGVYGPLTARGVRLWQLAHRLRADGIFGPASANAAGWAWAGA